MQRETKGLLNIYIFRQFYRKEERECVYPNQPIKIKLVSLINRSSEIKKKIREKLDYDYAIINFVYLY